MGPALRPVRKVTNLPRATGLHERPCAPAQDQLHSLSVQDETLGPAGFEFNELHSGDRQAVMQQIAHWLKQLGMHEYTQRFAENDIDFDILKDLTDQDLEKMGIKSVGHRRRLLGAIADLKGIEKTTSEVSTAAAPHATPRAIDAAERRQVTVMFSDLVGSTALSARMDPEDLRELISAYHKCAAEAVRRFGGFVTQYLGDGVLVCFGYPEAHEDDAERAVRAGLGLIAAVSALKGPSSLQTRVGIATGLVVVGDLTGSAEVQDRGIVGETPNLAARLQGIAEPNSVVIAESTRRLVGNLFELDDLASRELKGIAGPVRAWAALRPASVESRFDAMHATGLTELVGREEELELLLRRWSKAKSGEGQVVLLSGEPGIGKSRLTAALLQRVASEPHTRLRYFCSPQRTDSAFFPIISQMERAAGFAHDDSSQAKLDKLDALLAQSFTPQHNAALLAEMLSLPNDGRYRSLDMAPQQRRQKTLEALTAQIEALSRINPLLMIFEDAHWSDPTSLEAFARAVDRLRHLRVLLLVTFRPEFEAPWIGRPYVMALTINRLTEREAGAMIDRIVGNKALLTGVRQDIIERTDGIPLFVEEMTKAVLEAGSEIAATHMAATIPSPLVAVPATLHASLMARLDRLGPAKEVAQIGAAVGREFSHAVLAAVVRRSEAELASALDRIIAAGLLFRQGVPPHATYLFKHALVQDAAYGTLLREPRHSLHAQIADTLENQFAEIAEKSAGTLSASLHRGWTDRKGRWTVGQGGTAVAGALGVCGGCGAAHTCACPDQNLARHAGTAPRADQPSGRAHSPTHPCQGTCRAGVQSRSGAGTSAYRTSGSARRGPRRPAALVLGPLQFLGRELCRVQRREFARACSAISHTGGKARNKSSVDDWTSPYGYVFVVYRKHRGMLGLFRSRDRALRSCRPSRAGDAICPRRQGGDFILSVVRLVDDWLSEGRARRRRERAQGFPGDRPRRYADVCPIPRTIDRYSLRELPDSNRGSGRGCRISGCKGRLGVQGAWNADERLLISPDRQGRGRNPGHRRRYYRTADNGSSFVGAVVFVDPWRRPMRNSVNSMRLRAALARR